MRKWLCCLLLLLPAWALAAPDTPYDPELMLYYPRLTAAQQQVFDLAYAAASIGSQQVNLPEGTAYDDAAAAMDALLLDCPELCALSSSYTLRYYQDAPHLATAIGLRYDMTLGEQALLLETAQRLAQQTQGDDFAREEFLHDALCSLAVYDDTATHQHNAYGALVEGRSVCDGYANAMALLLRLAGVECGVVQGMTSTGAPHAWNLVRVDGAYTWLDVTNDDQGEVLTHFFYNITDEWLLRSYTLQTENLPSCTDETANWHVRRGLYARGAAPLLPADRLQLELRFARREDYTALRDGLSSWLMHSGIQGTIAAWCDDAQWCILVQLGKD